MNSHAHLPLPSAPAFLKALCLAAFAATGSTYAQLSAPGSQIIVMPLYGESGNEGLLIFPGKTRAANLMLHCLEGRPAAALITPLTLQAGGEQLQYSFDGGAFQPLTSQRSEHVLHFGPELANGAGGPDFWQQAGDVSALTLLFPANGKLTQEEFSLQGFKEAFTAVNRCQAE